jgi:hypothetical protein
MSTILKEKYPKKDSIPGKSILFGIVSNIESSHQ